MSKVFEDGMARRGSKSKTRTYRKVRQSKRRRKTVRRFSGQGPARGFNLVYDPDDSYFPRRWVLSFGDLILEVRGKLCLELWNRLTEDHQDQCKESFVPASPEVQERRRRIDNEEFRRIMFWDKVTRLGRKKHSKGPVTSVEIMGSGRGSG